MEQTGKLGLSAAEAALRLKHYGPNELPNPERRTPRQIAWRIVRQPMFALLLGGALVYLLVGEPLDAALLGLFATFSVSINIIQESRSERILESLRDLASPKALVMRDGKPRRIAGRDVVPGDLIILSEGDRIPADGVVVAGNDLLADESLLTGESVPVRKKSGPDDALKPAPGGDDQPFVYAGTLLARGSGIAHVTATGPLSEMGKIGQTLSAIAIEQPRLQTQLRWLVRDFALVGGSVAGLVVVIMGLARGAWLNALLAGIAVGMSVVPEEIPLVLAVFMAMGARRISRAGVLTRRASAIETLGSATVLCTDKTGTLTENRMQVALLVSANTQWRPGEPITDSSRQVLQGALGASAPLPIDPMDRAVHDAAAAADLNPFDGLVKSYGVRPELPATSNLWNDPARTGSMRAYVKGAPEAVVGLCRFTEDQRKRLLDRVTEFAAQGLRLLAVADADIPAGKRAGFSEDLHAIPFRYVGLIGFADPLRATVPAAIAECRTAGIRVIMITGDYPATARTIAQQAGIDAEAVLDGAALDKLDDTQLAARMRTTSVFARIRPQQKFRLVEALKLDGEIVAMTGDGVNDAPALKAAHIAIAMGGRGTDVAREASALVLLNDDFASIVAAVRLGRRIYDNLRKALDYIVAVHIPIAGLALLPLFLGLPLILMPVHIALLEMVIDPACSIVFEGEREEADLMCRPPRPPNEPLLSARRVIWPVVQGLAAFGAVALALIMGAHSGMPENALRASVYCLLVLSNLGLILVNRSFRASIRVALLRPNPMLWILVTAITLVLAGAIVWPPAQSLFHFERPPAKALLWCVLAGFGLIGILELGKSFLSPGFEKFDKYQRPAQRPR